MCWPTDFMGKNSGSSSIGSVGNSLIFPKSVLHWFPREREREHAPRRLKMKDVCIHMYVCMFKWVWTPMYMCVLMCIETQSWLAIPDCFSLYLSIQGLMLNPNLTDSGQPPSQLVRAMPVSISLVLVL